MARVRADPQRQLAAALNLGGAILGFCLPLASTIAHSVSIADVAMWALVALVVQIGVPSSVG